MTSPRDQDRYRKGSHPSPTRSTSEKPRSPALEMSLSDSKCSFCISLLFSYLFRPGSLQSAVASCHLFLVLCYFTLSKLYKSCRTFVSLHSSTKCFSSSTWFRTYNILSPLLFLFPPLSLRSRCECPPSCLMRLLRRDSRKSSRVQRRVKFSAEDKFLASASSSLFIFIFFSRFCLYPSAPTSPQNRTRTSHPLFDPQHCTALLFSCELSLAFYL